MANFGAALLREMGWCLPFEKARRTT
ncbi:hypothetical protein F9L69_02220 [Brucella melitensis]|uniref:Uncharacterized protein n=3 Tax=Brucella TaxID=234 RepID=A0AAI8E972_BRUSS|nr:hypothetical protein CJJ12_00850 [Brucella melitensis]ASU72708.1 hypothetical protein CJP69_05140 [Brucella abortus]ATN21309.1 hypothetical protein CRN66_06060 [Brucella canis]ATQ53135.1 hypothetical protein CS875_05720 [Brucella suis]QFR26346.1 hypothetical protein FZX15_06430 [Brucella suis bv. 1]QIS28921.1 hypothetical protein F6460_05515 [Brucella abortus RB51-AHVLA]QOK53154.1 G patch domain-containing protein [Brucella suis bv. 2]QOK62082.1 G patch domain-containing protein [Brucella